MEEEKDREKGINGLKTDRPSVAANVPTVFYVRAIPTKTAKWEAAPVSQPGKGGTINLNDEMRLPKQEHASASSPTRIFISLQMLMYSISIFYPQVLTYFPV
jgi:hypothetical protein